MEEETVGVAIGSECRAVEPDVVERENRIRSINIEPLDYGFILRVGFQSLAIESKQDLIKYLTDYLNNPNKTESKYYDKQLLKHQ